MPTRPEDTAALADAVRALGQARSRAEVDALQAGFAAAAAPEHAAIVADVARLARARLRALEDARRDALTGVLNRRGFQQACRERVARAPGAVVVGVFDLDGLKGINDRHGHDAGSRALRAAAEALLATFGDDAVVGRVGGDEFAVLTPGATPTAQLRSRLHATVRGRAALPDVVGLALSAGFATGVAHRAVDVEALLRRADADLYRRRREARRDTPRLRLVDAEPSSRIAS